MQQHGYTVPLAGNAPPAELPPVPGEHWREFVTADGRKCYYNELTRTTSYTAPPKFRAAESTKPISGFPDGWEDWMQVKDAGTGHSYYWDSAKNTVCWEPPFRLPVWRMYREGASSVQVEVLPDPRLEVTQELVVSSTIEGPLALHWASCKVTHSSASA